jgi:hypothetical protein
MWVGVGVCAFVSLSLYLFRSLPRARSLSLSFRQETTEENKLNLIVLLVALIGVVVFVACCSSLW